MEVDGYIQEHSWSCWGRNNWRWKTGTSTFVVWSGWCSWEDYRLLEGRDFALIFVRMSMDERWASMEKIHKSSQKSEESKMNITGVAKHVLTLVPECHSLTIVPERVLVLLCQVSTESLTTWRYWGSKPQNYSQRNTTGYAWMTIWSKLLQQDAELHDCQGTVEAIRTWNTYLISKCLCRVIAFVSLPLYQWRLAAPPKRPVPAMIDRPTDSYKTLPLPPSNLLRTSYHKTHKQQTIYNKLPSILLLLQTSKYILNKRQINQYAWSSRTNQGPLQGQGRGLYHLPWWCWGGTEVEDWQDHPSCSSRQLFQDLRYSQVSYTSVWSSCWRWWKLNLTPPFWKVVIKAVWAHKNDDSTSES